MTTPPLLARIAGLSNPANRLTLDATFRSARTVRSLLRCLFLIASLTANGIAATYFIDYVGGADSNNGTSTSTPWKRHPYMVGWTGNYSHASGDRFIFKGGVTWPSTVLPLTVAASGTAGNVDYYGVDTSWYAGGSWTRPIFDGEYADDSCISIGSRTYLTIDNLELKRVSSSSNYGYGLIEGVAPTNVTIQNCYLHGWRTSSGTDDAHGGVIMTSFASGVNTNVIDRCEIENSENAAAWNGVAVRMWGTIRNSSIHDNSSAVLFCLDFDNNDLYNISYPNSGFDGAYHFNGVYLDAQTLGKTVGYIRNSRFRDCSGGTNMAYLNGRNATLYCYNNIFWGQISDQRAIEIEPYDYGANQTSGTYHIYNNTGAIEQGTPLVRVVNRSGRPQPSSIVLRNNHIIGSSVSLDDNGPSASYTRSNNT